MSTQLQSCVDSRPGRGHAGSGCLLGLTETEQAAERAPMIPGRPCLGSSLAHCWCLGSWPSERASQVSTRTESRHSPSSRTTCSAGPAAARTGVTENGVSLHLQSRLLCSGARTHLSISLFLLLALLSLSRIGMSPAPRDSLVVTCLGSGQPNTGSPGQLDRPVSSHRYDVIGSTDHAVYPRACLCKHELFDLLAAVPTREACRVVRLVSCRKKVRPGQTSAII